MLSDWMDGLDGGFSDGAHRHVRLARLVEAVAVDLLEVRVGALVGIPEALAQRAQALVEARDALAAADEVVGQRLVSVDVQAQVHSAGVHRGQDVEDLGAALHGWVFPLTI